MPESLGDPSFRSAHARCELVPINQAPGKVAQNENDNEFRMTG